MTPAGRAGGAVEAGTDGPGTAARSRRIAAWTRPAVRDLDPYYQAPLQGDPLRLDQNTNLWGPNPVLARLDATRLDAAQYPTRDADRLMAALAKHHGLDATHFVAGNGSDEILDLITKAFTSPGQTLAVPWPGYSLYPFYAKLQDLRFARVPLRGGHRLDVDAIAAADPDLVVVASPNNPTGDRHPVGELERLLEAVDGVVVVDEAYMEYAGEKHSLLGRVEAFDNLIVTRTFSKAFALAGLRIGYAAANTELATRLRLVKPPFNLNLLSEEAAVLALQDAAWMHDVVERTQEERERMAGVLGELGFRVHPSAANFLLTDSPIDPGVVVAGLRRRGILVRVFPGADGLESAVRFTVGRPEHTDALRSALQDILAEGAG